MVAPTETPTFIPEPPTPTWTPEVVAPTETPTFTPEPPTPTWTAEPLTPTWTPEAAQTPIPAEIPTLVVPEVPPPADAAGSKAVRRPVRGMGATASARYLPRRA